ncbi:MAG: hypothetical protein OXE47_09415 [Gammaproteobacteria bacterium]|nr:hypothetical protein [Gammaproteobacteria bacterium]
MSLEQYKEPIEVAREPLGDGYVAFRMDGGRNKPSMQASLGLGSCHCCDYFLPHGEAIVLIEETELVSTIKNIKQDYPCLNKEDKKKFVNTSIRQENLLKVYGAMLVLCRLAARCRNAKQITQDKKYDFWLVASSMDSSGDDRRYFDNIRDKLRLELDNALTSGAIRVVELLTPEDLKKKLSQIS